MGTTQARLKCAKASAGAPEVSLSPGVTEGGSDAVRWPFPTWRDTEHAWLSGKASSDLWPARLPFCTTATSTATSTYRTCTLSSRACQSSNAAKPDGTELSSGPAPSELFFTSSCWGQSKNKITFYSVHVCTGILLQRPCLVR